MIKNMGSNGKPSWFVKVSVRRPGGQGFVQRKRSGISNKAEAIRVERDLFAEAKAISRVGIVPVWENVVEAYLRDAENKSVISANTVHQYRVHLNAHTLQRWRRRLVDTITRKDVLELLNDELPGRAQSHLKYVNKCISAVFRHAIDCGYCVHNPCSGIRFKIQQPDLNIWNADQVSRFLSAARRGNCEWYPVWAFALHTGMRSGELYALQWKHLDLEKLVIKVCQAWTSKTGIKSTKNRQIRMVPINPSLEVFAKELRLRSGSDPEEFVLPRLPKWSKGEQARELRMFILGLGLPEIRFHDLRATFASQLLLSGAPIHLVQVICGWADLKTAQRYLRLSGREILGATNDLGYGLPTDKIAEVFPIFSTT